MLAIASLATRLTNPVVFMNSIVYPRNPLFGLDSRYCSPNFQQRLPVTIVLFPTTAMAAFRINTGGFVLQYFFKDCSHSSWFCRRAHSGRGWAVISFSISVRFIHILIYSADSSFKGSPKCPRLVGSTSTLSVDIADTQTSAQSPQHLRRRCSVSSRFWAKVSYPHAQRPSS